MITGGDVKAPIASVHCFFQPFAFADIPFDLRHHFHIVYDSICNLKEKVFEHIAWHVAHPDEDKVTAGESARFYIDGKLLVPDAEHQAPYGPYFGDTAFVIDLDVHNPNGAGFEKFAITPALITPAQFANCKNFERGAPDSTIRRALNTEFCDNPLWLLVTSQQR